MKVVKKVVILLWVEILLIFCTVNASAGSVVIYYDEIVSEYQL